ncbi:MAG: HesA/MoeB/ThiF family protein [archaeon]|nr:HesA/MoeB/ThiF family protein [archaeon]
MLTEDQKNRYERQIREIGEDGQEILLSKKVVQLGVGGLGSALSYYLTAAGIGELTIIDNDVVDPSNLNRQIVYTYEDISKPKTKIAAERLSNLNPDIKINTIQAFATEKNFEQYCKGADYIIDASDNLKTKMLVNDIGLKLNIPFTIAGVQRMEGQIISVDPHVSACYRCVFGNVNEKKRDSSIGVFGFAAGFFGTIQAGEVIKGLLGNGKRLLNTMLMINLKDMNWMKVKIVKNENCIC